MSQQLFRILLRDTFVIGTSLWAFLFVVDVIKPGFASNYLALPESAVVLFVLAVIMLAGGPDMEISKPDQSHNSWWFFGGLALVMLVSLLALGLPWWLTIVLTSVTLMSFWALRFIGRE